MDLLQVAIHLGRESTRLTCYLETKLFQKENGFTLFSSLPKI